MDKPSSTNGIDVNHYILDQSANWLCLQSCAKNIPHGDAETHHGNADLLKSLPPPETVMTIGQQMMKELYSLSNRLHPVIYASIYTNIKHVLDS